jgi:hypothetical protein
MAIGLISAPKVATGLSPGFQPWESLKNEFALKGREAANDERPQLRRATIALNPQRLLSERELL